MSQAPRVMYVQYTNPAAYPPLVNSMRLLVANGFDVLVLGTSTMGVALALSPNDRIKVTLLPFQSPGWRQKLHYFVFAAWVLVWVLRWRPSWVYVSDPLSTPIALALSWLPRMRLVYHEHDSPPESTNGSRSVSMAFVGWARRIAARRSALCILPNHERAGIFKKTTGGVIPLTIWNCPSIREVSGPRQNGGEHLRVLYHGSVVPARLPVSVIEALARLPSQVSLVVRGYETVGHFGYIRELQRAAERWGVADRVSFVGTAPTREELMRLCATADVGLALLTIGTTDVNERTMIGASNKPFDYLACGLAVLVSDLPDWRATYVEPGYGRSCDPRSVDSLADEMRWFLEHPTERSAMGARGRRRVLQEWNYEHQFSPVLRLLAGNTPDSAADVVRRRE